MYQNKTLLISALTILLGAQSVLAQATDLSEHRDVNRYEYSISAPSFGTIDLSSEVELGASDMQEVSHTMGYSTNASQTGIRGIVELRKVFSGTEEYFLGVSIDY